MTSPTSSKELQVELDEQLIKILEQFGIAIGEVNKMKVAKPDWAFKFSAAYKSLHKAKDQIKTLNERIITKATEALLDKARIDENKSIESMLIDEINDLRTCCFNHDKFTPQCHACQKFKWRKIIAKEYLESIQDRLTTLRKEGKLYEQD